VKRREVVERIRKAADAAGLVREVVQLSRHTGIRVGDVPTTISRSSSDIPNVHAGTILKQLEPASGEGWWRR
jgi:hypothetical protein